MNLCDINEIEQILKKHGFKFSKSLGQNFLTADFVPKDIARYCGATEDDGILEVGPGMGCLTVELSKVCKNVVSIELDKTLFPILDETLVDCDNVKIIQGDVLKADLETICSENFEENMDIHACANLPYYITTPAIARLIDSKKFKSITIMVQKEVAKRMCAKEGTKAYGAFTLYVNYHTKPEILFEVDADLFIPKPKVDSAVIRLECLDKPSVEPIDEKLFFKIIKSSFMQRRKTLLNSIQSAFDGRLSKEEISEVIIKAGFDPSIRGERLSISDFATLSNVSVQMINLK